MSTTYTKQNFVDGQVLKAEHLNTMEDGISQLSDDISTLEKKLDKISSSGGGSTAIISNGSTVLVENASVTEVDENTIEIGG